MEAQDWLVKTYEQKGELEEAQRVLLRSMANVSQFDESAKNFWAKSHSSEVI